MVGEVVVLGTIKTQKSKAFYFFTFFNISNFIYKPVNIVVYNFDIFFIIFMGVSLSIFENFWNLKSKFMQYLLIY